MILKNLCIITALGLVATPVAGLSCLPHSVTDTYQRLDAQDTRYVVVHGTLSFDQGLVPTVDPANQASTPQSTEIPAHFVGKSLGKKGYTRDFATDLTLDLRCAGPWCAGAKTGTDYLAFLARNTEGEFRVTLGPCGGDGFADPTAEQLEQAHTCFTGGPCVAKFSQ